MRLSLLLLLVTACTPRSTAPKAAATHAVVGDLEIRCPDGASLAGAAPPAGSEIYCQRIGVTGTWQRHGPFAAFHVDGTLAAQGQYASGMKVGAWRVWRGDGTLDHEASYVSDRLHGLYAAYYPSGETRARGTYSEGHKQGLWTYYDEQGFKTEEGPYTVDERDGEWTEFGGPAHAPVRTKLYRLGRLARQTEL